MTSETFKHLIIVEGQTDKDFFLALVNKRLNFQGNNDIGFRIPKETLDPQTTKPLTTGGKNGVKRTIEILLTVRPAGVKSIFAIVDADDNYCERCKELKEVFQKAGFNVPAPNIPVKQNGLWVGFFVIGQEAKPANFKDLETLLFQIKTPPTKIPIEKPLTDFESFIQISEVSHPNKSKMSIYLAHLPKFSNHFGKALKNKYFNSDAPELAFLDNLLNHIKPADTVPQATP